MNQRAEFDREIRTSVQRFSKLLDDEEIAGLLVSNAFVVNLRQHELGDAFARTSFAVEALGEAFDRRR